MKEHIVSFLGELEKDVPHVYNLYDFYDVRTCLFNQIDCKALSYVDYDTYKACKKWKRVNYIRVFIRETLNHKTTISLYAQGFYDLFTMESLEWARYSRRYTLGALRKSDESHFIIGEAFTENELKENAAIYFSKFCDLNGYREYEFSTSLYLEMIDREKHLTKISL